MTRPVRLIAAPVYLAALAALSVGPALAGDLDPPVGAVTPTMITLDEVEPRIPINDANTPGDADSVFRIDQPGSYYLTQSIIGQPLKMGLEIAASNVTVDLMGYEIIGVTDSTYGVRSFGASKLKLMNGAVRGFGYRGIDTSTAPASVYRNLTIAENGDIGIFTSSDCIVEGCTAYANSDTGFNISSGCVVRGCVAYLNESYGMALSAQCIVEDCTSRDNQWAGIFGTGAGTVIRNCHAWSNWAIGIRVATGGVIDNCTSESNGQEGFEILTGVISNCSARANQSAGINATSVTIVRNNTSRDNNGTGIIAGIGCRVEGNTVYGNPSGISTSSFGSVVIVGNSVTSNDAHGIYVPGPRARVEGNDVSQNGANGIYVTGDDFRISDNNVFENTTNGIYALGDRGRIENNQVSAGATGIHVDGTFNMIVRNYCADNTTNYDFAAGNRFGQIFDWTATIGSPPVSGSSALGQMGTNDNYANFSK